jgi:hypothetical protein
MFAPIAVNGCVLISTQGTNELERYCGLTQEQAVVPGALEIRAGFQAGDRVVVTSYAADKPTFETCDLGFQRCTPFPVGWRPLGHDGKDVLAQAKSGKIARFSYGGLVLHKDEILGRSSDHLISVAVLGRR